MMVLTFIFLNVVPYFAFVNEYAHRVAPAQKFFYAHIGGFVFSRFATVIIFETFFVRAAMLSMMICIDFRFCIHFSFFLESFSKTHLFKIIY